MSAIDKTAQDIKELHQSIYVPRHEYRQVDASTFRHLDLKFYDALRDTLIAQGCAWLGDVENLSLKQTAFDPRSFIRILVSKDQTTCIGLYHVRPRFWVRLLLWIFRVKLGKMIDCETELSNGAYVVTSNATEAGKLNLPPNLDRKFFPLNTPHMIVFEEHQRRLKDIFATDPHVLATTMRTVEEALEMQHRMQAVKAAYRKGIGYVTEDELRRLGASPQTASEIKQAMTRSQS